MRDRNYQCLVKNCISNRVKNENLSYFTLSKVEEKRNLWLKALDICPTSLKHKIYYVCEIHFRPEDYTDSCMKLKRIAVPSLHLNAESTSSNPLISPSTSVEIKDNLNRDVDVLKETIPTDVRQKPQQKNNSPSELVSVDLKEELHEKYKILNAIVHEWTTQRSLKLHFSLTNYGLNQTATLVAKFLEITDFKDNQNWCSDFKEQYNIKCVKETPALLRCATNALDAVKIFDIAKEFRAQNKFPEFIKKIYDLKFQYKPVSEESKKELNEKYKILNAIVHEWTQRCLKLNYTLTDYAINETAIFVAKFFEITDFKVSCLWTANFKNQYNINCVEETPAVLRCATEALNAVKVLDIARDFRAQNKFPDFIKKMFDLKFQYKPVSEESKKELNEKYKILNAIVHEWTQRCLKLNYTLTNYTINETAIFVAKFLEITDFKVSRLWTTNFKNQYNINCVKETPEILSRSIKALHDVKIFDIAREFQAQNKFPECVKKNYDPKFQDKDLNDKTSMKPQKDNSNVIDLTETCEETINNLPATANAKISDVQIISIATIPQEAIELTNTLDLPQNNNINPILDKNSIPCAKISKTKDCKNKRVTRSCNTKQKNIKNLKDNSKQNLKIIKKNTPKKLNISSEVTSKCKSGTQVSQSNDPVPATVNQDDKLIQNETEESNKNSENVSSNESLAPVNSYEEALIRLKLLEDFAFISYDFKAINHISNLEDIFVNCRKEEEQQ